MMVGQVMSNMWGEYVIYLFPDKKNLPGTLIVNKLDILCFLCNDGKLKYYENIDLPERLMVVVHIHRRILYDTEDDHESEEEGSDLISIEKEDSENTGD